MCVGYETHQKIHFTIKKLYGRFSYDIDTMEDGITILTGPNGFGKSTILKCIKAISDSDVRFFAELHFEHLEFTSTRGHVVITKNEERLTINGFEYSVQQLLQQNPRRWFVSGDRAEKHTSILNTLHNIGGDAQLIKEQRLFVEEVVRSPVTNRIIDQRFRESILDIPMKLKEKISATIHQGIELDRSFPAQILKANPRGVYNKEQYDEAYAKIEKDLLDLRENGIFETSVPLEFSYTETTAKLWNLYYNHFQRKYTLYKPLIDRLNLFRRIVNNRFKFKKLKINQEKFMCVFDENNDCCIPLDRLSSGEKECIILFYYLIFSAKSDTIILVDEPEISLHVAWQVHFIDELREIAKMNKMIVIIATHSPNIIEGNWDNQIDLGVLYQHGSV